MKILLVLLAAHTIEAGTVDKVELRPFVPESVVSADGSAVVAQEKQEEQIKQPEHKHFLAKEAMKPVHAIGSGLHFVGHKISRGIIYIGDKTAPYQNALNFVSSVGGAVSGAGILTGLIRNGGKL